MSHLETVGIGEALGLRVGLAVVLAFGVVSDVPELVIAVCVLFAAVVLGAVVDCLVVVPAVDRGVVVFGDLVVLRVRLIICCEVMVMFGSTVIGAVAGNGMVVFEVAVAGDVLEAVVIVMAVVLEAVGVLEVAVVLEAVVVILVVVSFVVIVVVDRVVASVVLGGVV
jgi:hypothetical protein